MLLVLISNHPEQLLMRNLQNYLPIELLKNDLTIQKLLKRETRTYIMQSINNKINFESI